MLSTEKNCRRAKTRHVWLLKLVEAAHAVRYWRTCQSNKMNNREPSAHLCALGQALQHVQMNAAAMRDKYLEELAQLNITGNQTDTATIIKNIRHQKEIKQSLCMMHAISKGKQGGT
eukprot:3946630-Ditylum_brightwellii.AAC.1